jgi:hypothetical protein
LLAKALIDSVMAEREGFEPSIEFPLYTLSRRAPSTTRPSLQTEKSFASCDAKLQDITAFEKGIYLPRLELAAAGAADAPPPDERPAEDVSAPPPIERPADAPAEPPLNDELLNV